MGESKKNDKQIHRFSAQPWPLQSQFLTSWTLSSPWMPSTPSPVLTLLLHCKWVCLVVGILSSQSSNTNGPNKESIYTSLWILHTFSAGFCIVSCWYDIILDFFKHGQKEENDIGIDSGIETSWVIINDEYYYNICASFKKTKYIHIHTPLFYRSFGSQIHTLIKLPNWSLDWWIFQQTLWMHLSFWWEPLVRDSHEGLYKSLEDGRNFPCFLGLKVPTMQEMNMISIGRTGR